ncbi:sugar-binding protein [Bacteroidota bacterium]
MNRLFKPKLNLILVSVVCCFIVTPQDLPEELIGVAKNGIPTIDVDIEDDWGEGYAFQGIVEGGVSDGDEDISVSWYALWSEEGLYLAFNIKDEYLDWGEDDLNNSDDGFNNNNWKYDCIMVFVNPTGERNPEDQTYATANASQVFFNPLDGTADYNNSGDGYVVDHLDELEWASEEVSDGYILESLIPWTAILPDPTNVPEKIGFTVNVGDSDEAGAHRECIALWVGAGLPDLQWNNINYFGLLHLSDDKAIPDVDLDEIYFYRQDEFQYMNEDKIVDFGRVDVNTDSNITIIIYNNGLVNFISSMEIIGEGFELVNGNSSLNIEPGTSEQISIKFIPDDIDQYIAELILYARDETYFTIGLTGIGGDYTNIVNNYEDNIIIHPNPATNCIYINTPIANKYEIEIYDLLGRKLLSKKATNNKEINISSVKKGSYIIKVYHTHKVYSKLFHKY